jgi:hypothetical protein
MKTNSNNLFLNYRDVVPYRTYDVMVGVFVHYYVTYKPVEELVKDVLHTFGISNYLQT